MKVIPSIMWSLLGCAPWVFMPSPSIAVSASPERKDLLNLRPNLVTAALTPREFSVTGGDLSLCLGDKDNDLQGIRIRETYRLPNGVESSLEEDYPVYAASRIHQFGGMARLVVCFRTGLQVKDAKQWQDYLKQTSKVSSDRASTAEKATVDAISVDAIEVKQPCVWISRPEPNCVEVSVSVYDKAGHASSYVPVEWFSGEEEIPAEETLDFYEYEKHGSEILQWSDDVEALKPDNAALLYYRAVACLARPDPCTARLANLLSLGSEPDGRIRAHLRRCLKGIQLAHLASRIPECDWGLDCDPASNLTMETFTSLRRLSYTLAYHAKVLAADGRYRVAFENCLVNRRFARHLGDDTYMFYLISRSVNANAILPMLTILENMPPDVAMLSWLRAQLLTMEGTPSQPATALAKWCGREVRGAFIDSAVHIMESNLPYQQKQAELEALDRNSGGHAQTATHPARPADANLEVQAYHEFLVCDETVLNLLRTAVEVLWVTSQSGKVPQILPEGAPKDLFTGADFLYEPTETGFTLRMDPADLSEQRKREFRFATRNP